MSREMPNEVSFVGDAVLVVRNEAVRLTPTQSFKLAEKLLRGATRQIVKEEAGIANEQPASKRRPR